MGDLKHLGALELDSLQMAPRELGPREDGRQLSATKTSSQRTNETGSRDRERKRSATPPPPPLRPRRSRRRQHSAPEDVLADPLAEAAPTKNGAESRSSVDSANFDNTSAPSVQPQHPPPQTWSLQGNSQAASVSKLPPL